MTTLTEILPSLRQLTNKEKLKAVQFLVNEIAVEEDAVFEEGGKYAVWSPFDSGDAAAKLMELLEQEKQNG